MKKSILNLGKTLAKDEQKRINGGFGASICSSLFFCALDCEDGDRCAYPNGTGGAVMGVISRGLCCPV